MSKEERLRAVKYLDAALQLNPYEDAAALVRRRAVYLGIAEPEPERSSMDDFKLQQLRHRIRERVDAIRAAFWTTPIDELHRQVGALDVRQFPELNTAVQRLRFVSTYRGDFPRLASHPKTDLNLFNAIKKIAVLPPREAGVYKEKFLRHAAASPSLKGMKQMVKTVKREFSGIYDLEADWFEQVARLQTTRPGGGADSSMSWEFELPVPPWLIVALIIFVIRILLLAARW